MKFSKSTFIIPEKEIRLNIFAKSANIKIENIPKPVLLAMAAVDLSQKIENAFASHFSRYGLTQSRFLLLVTMFSEKSRKWTSRELAQAIGVKPPTLTGIIDGLIKEGLVKRENDIDDRRKVLVSLTQSGIKKITNVIPDHIQRIKSAFAGLQKVSAEFETIADAVSLSLQQLGDKK